MNRKLRLPEQTVYSKALALFVALSALLGAAVVWLTQTIIANEFRRTEIREVGTSLERLEAMLDRQIEGLSTSLSGWAALGPGGTGGQTLLPGQTLLDLLRLDFAIALDSEGKTIQSEIPPHLEDRRDELELGLRRVEIAAGEMPDEVEGGGGFVAAGDTLVAVGWTRLPHAPGKPRFLLGGRLIEGGSLVYLESILNGTIAFRALRNEVIGPPGTEYLSAMMATDEPYVGEPTGEEISGSMLVRGPDGSYLGILSLSQTRSLAPAGEGAVEVFLTVLVLAGGVLFIAVWFVLDWTILRRIRALTTEVESCRSLGHLPVKLGFRGKDELGQLARRIEDLAGLLETVQNQYRAVVEDQTEVICRFREDYQLTFANDVFLRLFGDNGRIASGLDGVLENGDFEFLTRRFLRLYATAPVDTFQHSVRLPGGSRVWFRSTLRRNFDVEGNPLGGQWVAGDVTAQVEAEREVQDSERQLRALSGRLMHLQDEERRRIARELHDSTAQSLSALEMNVSLLDPLARDARTRRIVDETRKIARDCCQELRNISYLLHPPLLDEVGLAFAARWFIDGFTERTGIAAELEVGDDFPRLQPDVETALFRVIQEAAGNIYRHSGASRAEISLWADASGAIRLRIRDNGRGISGKIPTAISGASTPKIGIGMAGMRERILQFGGNLSIENSPKGVTISIVIPPQRAYPSHG